VVRDGFTNVLFAVATIFFFFGFVVFEGLKVEFPRDTGSMVNPYVVLGFIFAFIATLYRFRKQVKEFFKA